MLTASLHHPFIINEGTSQMLRAHRWSIRRDHLVTVGWGIAALLAGIAAVFIAGGLLGHYLLTIACSP